jgi:hypothetical protein
LAGIGLLGFAIGAEIEIAAYFVVRYFGVASFGVIYGALLGVYSTASAIGPLSMALGFRHFGGYDVLGIGLAACLIVAIIQIATLGKYRYAK